MLVIALILATIQLFVSANSGQPPPFELPVIYDAKILEDGCPNDVQVRTMLEEELRGVLRSMILPRIVLAVKLLSITQNSHQVSIGSKVLIVTLQCRCTVTWTGCVAATAPEAGHVLPTST